MSEAYAQRQAERDREYRDAWASPEAQAWLAALPPDERKRLEADGTLAPMLAKGGGGSLRDRDLADSPLASETPDIAVAVDGPDASDGSDALGRGDVLASFCARMRGCANPALVFDAVCYGTGVLAIEGQSATELAAKHGVTKQAFSKIAVQWCTTFGLPPARSMKSKGARKAYRQRAKAVHARRDLTQRKAA
jgi:hypothetical protein